MSISNQISMVSTQRMRIDLIGQIVLILAILIQLMFLSGLAWPKAFLGLLIFWQFLSATHLLISYQYVKKLNYLKVGLVLIISLPIWIKLIGLWAYLPVLGIVLWYFIQTWKDTIVVMRRPRSFWDL